MARSPESVNENLICRAKVRSRKLRRMHLFLLALFSLFFFLGLDHLLELYQNSPKTGLVVLRSVHLCLETTRVKIYLVFDVGLLAVALHD